MSRRFIGGTASQWVKQEVGKVTAENAAERYGQYIRSGEQLDTLGPGTGDEAREVARQIKEKFNVSAD